MSSKEYFMTLEAEELASELEARHTLNRSEGYNPIHRMWVRNLYAYYSTVLDAESWVTSLGFAGDQGELVKMTVPQSRAMIRQLLTLITKQKLAFNALAENSGSDITEEMRVANALAVAVVEDAALDLKVDKLVESALVVGTSYISARWRSDRGTPRAVKDVGEDKKQVIYDGDLEIALHTVFDVTYDFTKEEWKEQDWVEIRVKRNRWDLIAQHPELETELLKLPNIVTDLTDAATTTKNNDDMVYVYEMYHRPRPSLPKGRMLVYGCPKSILYDDVNPYGTIPIEIYKPEPIEGMGFGYAMLSNLLPAQEMLDHSWSCIATNQSALGVQNITVARNSNLNVQQLYGMNLMEYTPQNAAGGGEPKALDLLKSAPELFKFPQEMLSNMQQMSFINAAIRGDLPAGTSGVAIATLTTNALEFLNSYTKNLQTLLQNLMYHSINAYQKFAKIDRMVSVVGRNYQSTKKSFNGNILSSIRGFRIDSVNPLMQTIAGRIDIAEKTMEKGLVKDLQSYVSILDGAPLNTLYKKELSENDLIADENERFVDGKEVLAMSVDNHPLHIMRHKELLNDPKIRANSPMVQALNEHILQHLDLELNTHPALKAMANTGMAPQQQEVPQQAMQPQMQDQMGSQEGAFKQPEPKQAKPAVGRAEDGLGRM